MFQLVNQNAKLIKVLFLFLGLLNMKLTQANERDIRFYVVDGVKSIYMEPLMITGTFGFYPWEKVDIEDEKSRRSSFAKHGSERAPIPIYPHYNFSKVILYASTPNEFISAEGNIQKKRFERTFFTRTFYNEVNVYMKNVRNHVFVIKTWEGNKYLIDLVKIYKNDNGQVFIADKEFIENYKLSSKVSDVLFNKRRNSVCFYTDNTDAEDFFGVTMISKRRYCLSQGVLLSALLSHSHRSD